MEGFITYIEESIAALKQQEKELRSSDRADEANLVKIKSNIFDICRTYYEVVGRTEKEENWIEAYPKKLEMLRQVWTTAYEKAKEHGDVANEVIGEIKIAALQEVLEQFQKIWREVHD